MAAAIDADTRYQLARYLAGGDWVDLDRLTTPSGRSLALALRGIEGEDKRTALAEALDYLYGPSQASNLRDAILATDPTKPPDPDSRNRRLGDILDDPADATVYTVANRLPVGLTLLAGRPKVGKSWLILDIAANVAQGHPVLGESRVRQGSVVLWALEDNWARIQARSFKQGIPRDVPLYVRTKPARLPEWVHDFADDLATHRPTLFVVDTLSRIIPPGASLNDSGEMTRALDVMQQLAFEHSAALLLIHHQRKNTESTDHLDNVMGATGIAGTADAILSMTRQRGADAAMLAITGRDIESELTLSLEWDRESCRWLTLEQAEWRPPEPPWLKGLIRRAIEEIGSGDASQIAEHIGKDRSTVQAELKKMRDSGELRGERDREQGRRIVYSLPAQADLTPEQAADKEKLRQAAIDEMLSMLDETNRQLDAEEQRRSQPDDR